MGVSIRDLGEKIKVSLQNDRVFYAAVGVCVAVISFGLGRLSVDVGRGVDRVAPHIQKIDARASTLEAGISGDAVPTTSPLGASVLGDSVPASTSPLVSGTYVGSKNSDKYHLPWCAGAKRIAEGNRVWFSSKEEAERAGYSAASNCPGI